MFDIASSLPQLDGVVSPRLFNETFYLCETLPGLTLLNFFLWGSSYNYSCIEGGKSMLYQINSAK